MIRLPSCKRIFYASNGITSKIIDMVNDNSTNLYLLFTKIFYKIWLFQKIVVSLQKVKL